jgi:outer membrane protein
LKNIIRFILVLVVSVQAFAQAGSSDVGAWVSWTSLKTDFDTEIDLDTELNFDEDMGYGASFNHYWTDLVSTDFGVQKMSADLTVSGLGVPKTTVGELDVTALTGTVQLHFLRESRFSPYVGAGAAYMLADFSANDLEPDDEQVELDDDVTFLVNAGVNVRMTERISLMGDVKYIPWEVNEENASTDDEALDVSPLIVSAGVRFRF